MGTIVFMTQKRSARLDLTPAGRMEEAGLQKVLGYQLAQAAIVTDAIFFEQAGKPFNLRPVEYTVLTLIAENPGGSLVRLARALCVTAPNITAMVDKLEAKGLIARQARAPAWQRCGLAGRRCRRNWTSRTTARRLACRCRATASWTRSRTAGRSSRRGRSGTRRRCRRWGGNSEVTGPGARDSGQDG